MYKLVIIFYVQNLILEGCFKVVPNTTAAGQAAAGELGGGGRGSSLIIWPLPHVAACPLPWCLHVLPPAPMPLLSGSCLSLWCLHPPHSFNPCPHPTCPPLTCSGAGLSSPAPASAPAPGPWPLAPVPPAWLPCCLPYVLLGFYNIAIVLLLVAQSSIRGWFHLYCSRFYDQFFLMQHLSPMLQIRMEILPGYCTEYVLRVQ